MSNISPSSAQSNSACCEYQRRWWRCLLLFGSLASDVTCDSAKRLWRTVGFWVQRFFVHSRIQHVVDTSAQTHQLKELLAGVCSSFLAASTDGGLIFVDGIALVCKQMSVKRRRVADVCFYSPGGASRLAVLSFGNRTVANQGSLIKKRSTAVSHRRRPL